MIDVSKFLRRADRVTKRTGRTPGGISKILFDDVRTLDYLREGGRAIQLNRLERAEARLSELEASLKRAA